MRKLFASIFPGYWEFMHKRPLTSVFVSLALAAACAGVVYLVLAQYRSYAR